jgi:hypothetical protein
MTSTWQQPEVRAACICCCWSHKTCNMAACTHNLKIMSLFGPPASPGGLAHQRMHASNASLMILTVRLAICWLGGCYQAWSGSWIDLVLLFERRVCSSLLLFCWAWVLALCASACSCLWIRMGSAQWSCVGSHVISSKALSTLSSRCVSSHAQRCTAMGWARLGLHLHAPWLSSCDPVTLPET